jgi:glutamine amidotransferase
VGPGRALARVATALAGAAPGSRLNFLLTDGRTLAGTAVGESLWYLPGPRESLTVASEPYDDGPGWRQVPDGQVITGDATHVELAPLEDL